MSNKRNLFAIVFGGAALIGVALHFFGAPKQASEPKIPTAAEAVPAVDVSPTPAFNVAAPTPQPTPSPEGPIPLLGPQLRKIGDCLQIHNSLDDKADLNFHSLQDSLRGELGDLLATDIDWQNVHFTLPNGEKRRLRIEIEGTGEEGSARVLKLYGVDKEDLPIPIPLTEAQSKNPSTEYIASIENQGQVTLREAASHGVFSKGADLFYTERNGFLSDLEISYEGKGVKCQDLQSSHGNCNCF